MLKEILSIAGKPGLQRLISNASNAIIVESLIDGKRFPAYSNSKIIALEDISIYTDSSYELRLTTKAHQAPHFGRGLGWVLKFLSFSLHNSTKRHIFAAK